MCNGSCHRNAKGTWVDETDIRPTLMYPVGLRDDYEHGGRVISEVLADPNREIADPDVARLGRCYKQLNSSVGEFGTATLVASTKGLESSSPGDQANLGTERVLTGLDRVRDAVAGQIKSELENAAFDRTPVRDPRGQLAACEG